VTKSKGTTVMDDPIEQALEVLDAPRRRHAESAAQAEQAASAAARGPVRTLIQAVLVAARMAGAPAEAQLARPLADGGATREQHFEIEDLRRFDGVLLSLTTTAQRTRALVGQLEALAEALEVATPEQLAAIETEARGLILQIASIRARGEIARGECQEAAAALAASVAVLQTHIAWLTPAEGA